MYEKHLTLDAVYTRVMTNNTAYCSYSFPPHKINILIHNSLASFFVGHRQTVQTEIRPLDRGFGQGLRYLLQNMNTNEKYHQQPLK